MSSINRHAEPSGECWSFWHNHMRRISGDAKQIRCNLKAFGINSRRLSTETDGIQIMDNELVDMVQVKVIFKEIDTL